MSTSTDAAAAAANGASSNAIAPSAQPATDAPWISYPPFPKPPPGVIIVPFKSFKPKGIYVVEDADGDASGDPKRVERDTLGIPTVMLASHHSLTEAERKRRSNKKLKKVEKSGDGTVRRLMWYEEWEMSERERRTMVDRNMAKADRLHQASQDFKSGRPWPALPSGVPQLWDNFRLYIGLISSIQPPPGNRRMKQMQQQLAEAEGGGESDDDSDDAMDGNPKPEKEVAIIDEERAQDEKLRNVPPKRGVFTDERREDFHETKDQRMDLFFDDTEFSLKVFFSSYFRDKGLIWSEQRVRDGPILIGFWLNFLLRNRILPEPEHEKGLRKALLVVEQARKELPQTFVIGKALPDSVGAGCEALWGTKGQINFWASAPLDGDKEKAADTQDGVEEPDAKRRKIDESETATLLKEVIGEDAKVEVLTPATVAAIEKDAQKVETAADADVDGPSDSGWGSGGWGDSANDTGVDSGGGWDDAEADAWAGDGGSTWDIEPQPNPLMAHLGATVLPFTHTTGVVERSTRKIVSVTPPLGLATTKAEKKRLKGLSEVGLVEDDLSARFAKMSLAPWPVSGTHEKSDVLPPEILHSSRGPVVEDKTATVDESVVPKPHNFYEDVITVLLDPAVAEKVLVGMSLGGAWVQIVRQNPGGAGEVDNQLGEPTGFWYIEQLTSVLPSYHTDACK
ncbi:hypothetical protein DAEQUDRAFT_763755 [Daedalea quercina L-15889]|uniref:Uncharacterized protein n=1 Tax=Daedalea quercina L-15889 TaxID=1314783 RepID=A0A165S4S0_9APHY|nr:hypothetical protein DAEQUDRAFT_763755 [Daedalea quercina L-15889]